LAAVTAEIVSTNPARPDDVVGRVTPSGGIDLDRAVRAAADAAPGWAQTTAAARGEALRWAADRLEVESGELASLICREVGKPIVEARGEVARSAAILRFHAAAALDPEGMSYPPADGRSLLFTRQVPRGVVGLITPWNFPLAIPLWKLAPALAYGNVCVMKPSEHSPVCADRIAGLFDGLLPDGVLQVLHGDGELGSALVGNELVRALSFTGSERTGRTVAERLAGRGAAAQCEMGGQNASIVLADADPTAAAAIIAGAAMGYAGQKCTATSRVICEEAAYPAVREALEAAVARMVVEDPEDEACQVGPLIAEAARDRALAAIGRAVDAGGRIVIGGEAWGDHGWYMQPTLVELDDPSAELAQEEVFGPVCALLRAADADDAVRIANDVRFGLSTAIFTRDLDRTLDLTRRLDTGLVRVNQPTAGVDFHTPFGGEKASGYGPREQGRAAREFYTQTRTVLVSPS
jgi:aldehyde dehydrogenase (NAD+)